MAEVCQAVEHSNRNANTVLGLRQGTGQSIVCSGVPSPIVGSRIRHLQELMVKCHLCDHVCLFCRLSLAPGFLDHPVTHQAHEANFFKVMYLNMVKNFPHCRLFDGGEILHRQVRRAMGEHGDEITEIL